MVFLNAFLPVGLRKQRVCLQVGVLETGPKTTDGHASLFLLELLDFFQHQLGRLILNDLRLLQKDFLGLQELLAERNGQIDLL